MYEKWKHFKEKLNMFFFEIDESSLERSYEQSSINLFNMLKVNIARNNHLIMIVLDQKDESREIYYISYTRNNIQ